MEKSGQEGGHSLGLGGCKRLLLLMGHSPRYPYAAFYAFFTKMPPLHDHFKTESWHPDMGGLLQSDLPGCHHLLQLPKQSYYPLCSSTGRCNRASRYAGVQLAHGWSFATPSLGILDVHSWGTRTVPNVKTQADRTLFLKGYVQGGLFCFEM